MPEGIDSERYRLEKHRRVEVPLPEQRKQQDVVQVADPEVVLAVASGHHHAGKSRDDSDQLQKAHSRSAKRERNVFYIKELHKCSSHRKPAIVC